MSETTRAAYRVRGRVQGVGFRWWAQRMGQEAGVRGRVWNCPDGSVRVDVEGSASAVAAFRARLTEGPPHASVEGVVDVDGPGPVEEESFRIVGFQEARGC